MTKSKRGLRRINKLSCPEDRIVYATLKPHIENADNNKNWLHNKSTLTILIEEKVFLPQKNMMKSKRNGSQTSIRYLRINKNNSRWDKIPLFKDPSNHFQQVVRDQHPSTEPRPNLAFGQTRFPINNLTTSDSKIM